MKYGRVILAGLIASVVMGMVQMIYEAVAGAGFWAPVVFIAATILRNLQHVSIPVPFLIGPVVLGLMGHMMNSVVLGLSFSWIVGGLRGATNLLMAGVVYGLVVFVAMWYLVVPAIDPVLLHLNMPVFLIAHVMWGAALGLVIAWGGTTVDRQQPLPA